jgi:hypothetical protein
VPDEIQRAIGLGNSRFALTNEVLRFAEEQVCAPVGSSFESSDIVASVGHVLASAAAKTSNRLQVEAMELEDFLGGKGHFGQVPMSLRSRGVYSLMTEEEAAKIARWVDSIDPKVFESEVKEVHGAKSVDVFKAVARAVQRILRSARIHSSDLCCWSSLRSANSTWPLRTGQH